MNQHIKTSELARVYESQGYTKEAFEIYSFLDAQETSNEIKAGLKRVEKMMGQEKPISQREENISQIFKKWLTLLMLKQRLDNLKKLKAACR